MKILLKLQVINDINCLANDRDYTDSSSQNYEFIKKYIKNLWKNN